jgi:prepilin-type N-terminal cleavage/methylation domain-containing protein/prepilin-type processing-associated H-X9-DG protein
MKMLSTKAKISGLTLIELVVVLAVIAILFAMISPRSGPKKQKSSTVICLNNERQTSLEFCLFNEDHNGRFPWQVSVTNGGAMESRIDGHPSSQFKSVLAYMKNFQIYVCPVDTNKQVAKSAADFNDLNISYFLNVSAGYATNNPSVTILSGDRNLQVDGKAIRPGLFILTTNLNINWTHDLHMRGGCMAFADGHVEYRQTNTLNSFVQQQPLAINQLAIP